MEQSTRSQALYNLATECALRRYGRKCKNHFGSVACQGCDLNVSEYINASPQDIKLFMFEAQNRAATLRHNAGVPVWVIVLIIAIGILAVPDIYYAVKRKQVATPPPTTTIAPPDIVWDTLMKVSNDLNRKKDTNKDGLINCIDAAVLFYKYYPRKNEVTIEVNYNPNTGMNHAFNCIWTNGVWRAIEPQTVWKGKSSYWMRDFWGSKYDSSFNEDQTATYKVYAK